MVKRYLGYGRRILLRSLAALTGALLLYALVALAGTLIPVNADYQPVNEGVTVYVNTNGFHTDIILPVQGRRDKCFRVLQEPDLATTYANYPYISFGWGDHNFYMESYQNQIPAVGTIFSTLFVPGKTLMHIDFYRQAPQPGKRVRKLFLTAAQYERLVDFIDASFRTDGQRFYKLPQAGYYHTDYFFEAEGHYHLFNTCNVWTGQALQHAGVKVSYRTPLEASVLYYLP